MRLYDAARARLKLLFARRASERRIDEEIGFHVEMETERLMRSGLPAGEARRQARVAFGGEEKYRGELRDGRGASSFSGMSLDFKLGLRMLRKYPGLTVVAVLALTFAVGVGAFGFEAIRQVAGPPLPYENGDRLVSIRLLDIAERDSRGLRRADLPDFAGSVSSLEVVGAWRNVRRNVQTGDEDLVATVLAEITPSAFAVTGERPLLGRPLVEGDAEAGADDVVVIGEDLWRSRFGGDPSVIGRVIRVGATRATVVGVMPQRFGFPLAHDVWVPLRDAHAVAMGDVELFALLRPDVTAAQAEADVQAAFSRLAAAHPDEYERVTIALLPYTHPYGVQAQQSLVRRVLYSTNLLFVLFVALIAANVAALVFARTATRESEIIVRSALGASRRRIVVQLFVEALLLGMIAVPAGLVLALVAMDWTMTTMRATGANLPFWITPTLSVPSVLFACLLALLGCMIAGAAPGLRVTRRVGTQLRQLSAGAGGPRLGRAVTASIVLQIAVTVIFVAFATYVVVRGAQINALDPGFAAQRYLSMQMQVDRSAFEDNRAQALQRFRTVREEIERRLLAEHDVAGVTFASRLPGSFHQRFITDIETPDSVLSDRIQLAWVAGDFFETLGSGIVNGRTFTDAEAAQGSRVAVLNEALVRALLGGRNPLGLRLRFTESGEDGEWSEWYEVVGVAADLPLTNDPELPHAGGIYLPLDTGVTSLHAAVAAAGSDAGPLESRVREVAAAVDPTMPISDVMTLAEVARSEVPVYELGMRVLIIASAFALLLSLAATYAVMSYSVARRTREIGIRLALGARPHRVIADVIGRHMLHACAGVAVGAGLLIVASGGIRSWRAALVVSLFVLVMLLVVLLSSVVPARRALAVQPAQALKME